jgi:dihydroorotate dehydrogenase (fumarate)/dihydroorotate dehydrogenase
VTVYESLARPVLFRLDPERAHYVAVRAAELGSRAPGLPELLAHALRVDDPRLRTRVAGIDFANPLGLAAGFDKNARCVPLLGSLGFGHIEVGSVSAHPSPGNPRPRLHRLVADEAIVVNYGVPSDGATAVAARLRSQRCAVPLGINLVKTNDPRRPAVEPDVYDDFVQSFTELRDCADYCTLNLSCPNSPADRDFFDDPQRIHSLLARLAELSPAGPVFLKLKPSPDEGVLREIVAIAAGFPFVAGFEINLPSGRREQLKLHTPPPLLADLPGAISGRPVEDLVNGVLAMLARLTEGRFALVAAGGISDAAGAYRKLRLGASLVQLYTALVYRGPGAAGGILTGLVELLELDGCSSVAVAVGAARR